MADTYSKEQIALLKEAQNLMRLVGLDLERQAEMQNDILEGNIKNNKQLREAVESTRKRVFQDRQVEKAEQEIADAKRDQKDLAKEILHPMRYASKLTDEIYEKDLARIQTAKDLGAISELEAASLTDRLNTLNKLAANPIAKQGFSAASQSIDSMQSGIDGFMKKLPGGDFFSKSLGIDKIGEKLENSLLSGGKAGAAAIAASVLIAFTALFAILKSITAEAKQLSAETGLTFGQAMKLNNEMREASTAIGVTVASHQDLVAVQKASIAEFGNAAILSGEIAANIAETGVAFGYGAAEAGKVNAEFMLMGQSGAEAAKSQERLAASALKAGVNVGAVMKDISTNARNVSKYFGGNVEALGKAAIEAQKLGISLATMGKTADHLLDFETSISAQFEYQAITGKQLNLDAARNLALQGDIAGAAREVVSQFGSLAELQAQGPLAMEAAAKAAGMTVDELTKSLAIQEKLGALSKEEQAAMTNLGLTAAEIQSKKPGELKALLANQMTLDQTNKTFEDIKNKIITALIPAAQVFGQILEALMPVLSIIGFAFQAIGVILIPIVDAVKGLVGLLTLSAGQLTNMQIILGAIAGIYLLIKGYALGTQIIEGITLAIEAAKGRMAAKRALVEKGGLIRSIGEAAMKVIQSFSGIPFGIGPALGIAAAAGVITLGYKFLNTGDLAMPAGGGPIVTNPREGTIFQGTKNDEVAMGPGVIGAAQRTQGVTMVAQQQQASSAGTAAAMSEQNRLLATIAEGQKTPAPVQIGTNVIRELNTSIQADKSFNKLGRYNR